MEDMTLLGSVRGSEWDAAKVKEATRCILQAYCTTLAVSVCCVSVVHLSYSCLHSQNTLLLLLLSLTTSLYVFALTISISSLTISIVY